MLAIRFSTVFALAISFLPSLAVDRPDDRAETNLDVRLPTLEKDRGGFVMRAPTALQKDAASNLANEIPGLTMRWDGMSASPKWLAAPPHLTLSPPMQGGPEKIARALLRSRAALFGLTEHEIDVLRVTSIVPSRGGGSHVHFAQHVAGLQVHGAHANVNVGPDGAIGSMGSGLYAGLVVAASPGLAAVEAVQTAVRDVYPEIAFSGQEARAEATGERKTVFSDAGFGRPPQARLVIFPEQEGARLA